MTILEAIRPIGTVASLPRGASAYQAGDPPDHWYWLSAGCIQICAPGEAGRRCIVEIVMPGDFFGLEACEQRGATAEVTRPAVLLCFPRQDADALIHADPNLAQAFTLLVGQRLEQTQARLLRLGRLGALGRVAAFLGEVAARSQADPGREFTLPLNREGIADYLGLKAETVSRQLSRLCRDGVIALPSRQHVVVLDPAGLRAAEGRAPEDIAPVAGA